MHYIASKYRYVGSSQSSVSRSLTVLVKFIFLHQINVPHKKNFNEPLQCGIKLQMTETGPLF